MFFRRILLLSAALLARSAMSLAAASPGPAAVALPIRYSTPTPTYPHSAMAARIEGTGKVQVVFDQQGGVAKAEMVKTTGSIILDRDTLKFVREHWKSSGGQRTTRTIEVVYRMPPSPPKKAEQGQVPVETSAAGWHMPHPPYPGEARFGHVTGAMELEMRSDASGRITHVTVVKSSGSDLLDSYTADYIRLTWRAPPGKPLVRYTTFEYVLR